MAGVGVSFNATYDTLLELKDAGVIAADAAAQVGGVDKILDLGAGEVRGDLIIDISAIEIASNDELYKICLQGSTKADFADTKVNLAVLLVGALEVLIGTDVDSVVGRYIVPFCNTLVGTAYRYVRIYTDVAGTIATGINYTAHLAKH